MSSCYYCKDYLIEENWCTLFDKSAADVDENCDSFEFDTGIDQSPMSTQTPKPLDASNGRRIPVESRSDSERDRPKKERMKE